LNVLGIDLEHSYQLQTLPFHHNDPFDRIVAQRFLKKMPIVSIDANFNKYDISVLW
jgi:PIN domain nuclease of toxin-antitoxin system